MKFIHLGDLHLGKTLGDFDLIRDQKYILDQILGIIRDNQVEGLLIAGDVYDKAIPSEAAVRLLDYFLSELAKAQVKTYMISGNHDSDDRLQFGSALFATSGIHISSVYNGAIPKEVVTDDKGDINIYLLPFVKASQVKAYYPDETIESYEDAVRVALQHTQVDTTKRNIILAHQYVVGTGSDPELGGSESIGTQNVGQIEKISYRLFDEFDYVALGHIHSPQQVGRREVRYAGSPLKYSVSEVATSKTVPLITMGEKGNVEIEQIPLESMRDVRAIRGRLGDLLNPENIVNNQDFIYVTLTEDTPVGDAMGIFREYYPNVVKIAFDTSHTQDNVEIDISEFVSNLSFEDIMKNFYFNIYGQDISEEEMDVMKEIARESGVTQ